MVILTLLAFIGLVWLREQILHGGGPEWLEMDANGLQNGPNQEQQPQNVVVGTVFLFIFSLLKRGFMQAILYIDIILRCTKDLDSIFHPIVEGNIVYCNC